MVKEGGGVCKNVCIVCVYVVYTCSYCIFVFVNRVCIIAVCVCVCVLCVQFLQLKLGWGHIIGFPMILSASAPPSVAFDRISYIFILKPQPVVQK